MNSKLLSNTNSYIQRINREVHNINNKLNFYSFKTVGLEKEAEFIQNRMLALEPRIEILTNEVEVRIFS